MTNSRAETAVAEEVLDDPPGAVRGDARGSGYERYVPPRWIEMWRSWAGAPRPAWSEPRHARGWRSLARSPRGHGSPLRLEQVSCNLCGPTIVEPVGVGEDFEYWTSPDSFLAVRCTACGLVYLDPRPEIDELARIYPPEYHAHEFTPQRFGIVYRVRERLESRRVRSMAKAVPPDGRIVDVGCGDGFFLDLLQRFGDPGWSLEGVEPDPAATSAARARGLVVHESTLRDSGIEAGSVDLVLLIQTIEHVGDPLELLRDIRRVLRPGGKVVVVTDNCGSPDFRIFRSRHWGGWHFPRHWTLYDERTLAETGRRAGLEVDGVTTIVSPVNWVYSLRNLLVDLNAPDLLVRQLALDAPIGLAVGTVLDSAFAVLGKGALLRATMHRPAGEPASEGAA